MKLDTLLDARTAGELGADALLEAIAPAGDFGRRVRERETPFLPGDEAAAQRALDDVHRAAQEIGAERVDALRVAIRAVGDVTILVERARLGEALDDVDFFELVRFLDAVAALSAAAEREPALDAKLPPPLAALRERLAPGRIPGALGPGFTLADAFEPALAGVRERLARCEARLRDARAQQAAAAAQTLGAAALRDGEFVVMRTQVDGALPADVRVVRETAAYRLCVLEPDAASRDADAARAAALDALAAHESRARTLLARAVADSADTVMRAIERIGELDAFLGRVRFTLRGTHAPRVATDRRLVLGEARFPPLESALASAGRRYVPISLELGDTAVLTGPNMGGKSAALRTCGYAALCVALGVPPPAREAAVPLFARIAWIGGGAAAALLSSFGDEIVHVRELARAPLERTLVLVDEFARTTTPREGRALVVGLAAVLAERDARALVATHFPDVARDAGVRHLAVTGIRGRTLAAVAAGDVRAALAALGEAMDYRITEVMGSDGSSEDALALAQLLGLDAQIVARARSVLRADG